MQAGSLLYSIRGNGQPFPMRPSSETEFFWEGLPGRVVFEISDDGTVLAMNVDADGSGREIVRSAKSD